MKRCLSWMMICVLCLMMLTVNRANAADGYKQEDIDTLDEYYYTAVEDLSNGNYSDALYQLELLIELYSELDGKGIEKTAYRYHYYYAMALVELHKTLPQYTDAAKWMNYCPGSYYNSAKYYQFALGMYYLDKGNYPDAFTNLNAVKDELSSEFSSQLTLEWEEGRDLYHQFVKVKGKEACDNNNHEKAQEYYTQYLDFFRPDPEIEDLLSICQSTHNIEKVAEEAELSKPKVRLSGNCATMTWTGNPEQYNVCATTDLINGMGEPVSVTGKTYTFNDLRPGTVYRFFVEYQGAMESVDIPTPAAEAYDGAKMSGTCTMYRFHYRYAFLDSGVFSYDYDDYVNYDENKSYLSKKTVALFKPPIAESCILFVFRGNKGGIPDDLEGKNYQLLLHVDGVTTLWENGIFGQANDDGVVKVCSKDDRVYVVVYDLFDQLVDNYAELSGKKFWLDLLVDGKLLATSEAERQQGMLQ